jgi:hypothetical protein
MRADVAGVGAVYMLVFACGCVQYLAPVASFCTATVLVAMQCVCFVGVSLCAM